MENNKPTILCACGCGLAVGRKFFDDKHKRAFYRKTGRYAQYEINRAEHHRIQNRLRKRRILANRNAFPAWKRRAYSAVKEQYQADADYWAGLEWNKTSCLKWAGGWGWQDVEKGRAKARIAAKLPKNRIKNTLRLRIRKTLRGQIKFGRTMELVGCTRDFLIKWLERQFTRGMSWDNYAEAWVVDHIQPCAQFDLSRESEQRKCFHYTNLRPLCKVQNMQKSDSIITCQPEFPMQISISPFNPGKQTPVAITHK